MDPELDAYLNLDLPAEDLEGGDDAFDEFVAASKLAGALGWPAAEGIARETSRIDKAIVRHTAPAPSNDSERLEKAVSFYVTWLENQMEKTAKSSREVISDWEADFPNASADVRSAIEEAARLIDAA